MWAFTELLRLVAQGSSNHHDHDASRRRYTIQCPSSGLSTQNKTKDMRVANGASTGNHANVVDEKLDQVSASILTKGTSSYTVVEQFIKQPRHMRVVIVGAGIAGLAMLYKTKNVPDIEVEAFEQCHDVGGVWLQNRYPGCSCDIPAHIYCYSFEGNPNWSQ